jgi:hypothetical protein
MVGCCNYPFKIIVILFPDVGILVENVAYDAAFGGNESSLKWLHILMEL